MIHTATAWFSEPGLQEMNAILSMQNTADLSWEESAVAHDLNCLRESTSPWRMSSHCNAESLKHLAKSPHQDVMTDLVEALRCIPGIATQIPRVEMVLHELFSNALDHGVLNIASSLKSSAEGFLEFYRQRQQAMENLQNAFVRIDVEYIPARSGPSGGGKLLVLVEDSGKGFHYQDLESAQQSAAPSLMPYGRGLKLVRSLSEQLRFIGCGNRVEVEISWLGVH